MTVTVFVSIDMHECKGRGLSTVPTIVLGTNIPSCLHSMMTVSKFSGDCVFK